MGISDGFDNDEDWKFLPKPQPEAKDARELAAMGQLRHELGMAGIFAPEHPARIAYEEIESRLAARGQEGAEPVESLRRIISQQTAEHDALVKNMHDLIDAADARANEYLARAVKAESEAKALREALTASEETKAAYISEFHFNITETREEDGEEFPRDVTVPWTTIKEIMAVILARTALRESAPGTSKEPL